MSLTQHTSSRSTWTLRIIGWTIALMIILPLAYKTMFRQQVAKKVECLEQAASTGRAVSPTTSVNKFAACELGQAAVSSKADSASTTGGNSTNASATASSDPLIAARCRYAGVWAATRGPMVYMVTLEADGRFIAEPSENTPPNAATITGAWSVAGNKMAWAYDNGPVWPPDINPITAAGDREFTLVEVNGATTRYELVDRLAGACR